MVGTVAFLRTRFTASVQNACSHIKTVVTMLQDDLRLWLPGKDNQESTGKDEKSEKNEKDKVDREDLDLETAHRLLRQVGDQFCDLLHQEKDALQEHMAEGKILFLLFSLFQNTCRTTNNPFFTPINSYVK